MKGHSAAFMAVAILAASLSIPGPAVSAKEPPAESGAGAYPEGLVYSVAEGDTLWDLSAQYLGSPWRWKEIWERNRFITNPHYIYPGIRIVIFPPPEKDIALHVPGVSAPGEAAKPGSIAAAPAPLKAPTLDISPSDYVRAGEFVKEKPAGIGRIRGGEEPKVAFSDGDKVFLSLDKEIPSGQLLGVYRVRGPIKPQGVRPVAGYAVYLVGIIQSIGKTDGKSAGIVRKSFEDLGGEDIVREDIPSYAPVLLNREGGVKIESYVISGQSENEELAAGNFVFLDLGAASGVAVGDVFRLFDESIRVTEGVTGKGKDILVEVAQAVVLRVSPEYSTAYVTKSQQSFSAGAKAVRGGTQPR